MSLENFFNSYVQTALWSSNDESNEQGGEPLDANYGPEDIHPDTLAKMRIECERFFAKGAHLWPDSTDERAGHDFWLTRNHHGAGYWDGDYKQGDTLTELAQQARECYLVVGDDGKIHQE